MKVNALRELIQRIDGEYVIPTKQNLLNYKAMMQGKNTYSQKLENTALASEMFVSGFRPWLENVASLSSLTAETRSNIFRMMLSPSLSLPLLKLSIVVGFV